MKKVVFKSRVEGRRSYGGMRVTNIRSYLRLLVSPTFRAHYSQAMRTLMCVPIVKYEMLGLAAKYGLSDVREGLSVIRDSVWSCFVQKVQL